MSRSNVSFLPLLAAATLLTGCVPLSSKPMVETARATVAPTAVRLNVPQKEINLEIVQSQTTAAMGGGLLWALVDSAVDNSRAKDAEQKVQAARDSMLGYDHDGTLRDALQAKLGAIDWLGLGAIEVSKDADAVQREQAVAATSARSILLIDSQYSLSPDASRIKVAMQAKLYTVTPEMQAKLKDRLDGVGKKPQSPLTDSQVEFATSIRFEGALAKPNKLLTDNIAAWTADDAKLGKAMLTRAAVELADLFAAEIQATAPRVAAKDAKKVKAGVGTLKLIEQKGDVSIVRAVDGALVAMYTASN